MYLNTDYIDSGLIQVQSGNALPLGCTIGHDGVNFAIVSESATKVELLLFSDQSRDPIVIIELSPEHNKTGSVWHIMLADLDLQGLCYGYRMDKDPNPHPEIYRFDPEKVLLDPYAKATSGAPVWGSALREAKDGQVRWVNFRGRVGHVYPEPFDWGDDRQLNIPMSDTIIYEMHVRGFTVHPDSGVDKKGTFLGLCEKIPYLKELGITAIELLPVYDFEEIETGRLDPLTGKLLLNYWGYHPISFFAPKASYAFDNDHGRQVTEFKEMVKTFHQAGIEVILDVVFNHTAEGNEMGPTYSFKGIDNPVYYMIGPEDGDYYNFSGCGNTVNCNQPIVRSLILDALHYWVTEMHVDGFRFDLASILGRGQNGEVLASPPLLEHIAHDPVLANTKLIAEAWDAAGLYQVGTFPAWQRWAEWNGKFRDDIRGFVKGDEDKVRAFADRMLGSPDIYQKSRREPFHSINFITSHDGFTLNDLVSYNKKHNLRNGEDNRDGDNHNLSWNCGVEGVTTDKKILRTRLQQQKNLATMLILADGVPMITAGDEFGRTQQGNNNAYCQDNEISWIDWSLLETNQELFRFFRMLISYRKKFVALRDHDFLIDNKDANVRFHGIKAEQPDWSSDSRVLGIQIVATDPEHKQEYDIYLFANMHWEAHTIELPRPRNGRRWHSVIDTYLVSPHDILESPKLLKDQKRYSASARSILLFEER